jgi:beta-lactamase regulating signal transducer with metallopeptidase domain
MSTVLTEWFTRMLSATLQGGLALLVVLALAACLPKLATVKVWLLRAALLKLHASAIVIGGVAWTILSGERRVLADPNTWLSQLTGYVMAAACFFWSISVVIGLWRHRQVRNTLTALVHDAIPVTDAPIYGQLCERMGIKRAPVLLAHPGIPSPLLIRNGTTSIVVPASLLAETDGGHLEAALAHELAHHRHGDLRWGWLLAATDLLFFFHPLATLALKKLRLYEECSADAAAMRATGSAPSGYCKTLLSFAESSVGVSGAYAMADGARDLDRRIKALYDQRGMTGRRRAAWTVAAILVGSFALLPWTIRFSSPGLSFPGPAASVRGQSRGVSAPMQRVWP